METKPLTDAQTGAPTTENLPTNPNKLIISKSGVLIPVLSLLAFLLFISTGFLYYKNQQLKSNLSSYWPQSTPLSMTESTPTPIPDPTANWKIYTNTKYNYSISFPNDFGTQVNAAGAGEQNATSNSDQIFLFKQSAKEPYLERYLEIVPIGQVVDLPPGQWQKVDVKINGITAVKFESNDPQTFIVYRLAIPNSSGELEIYITKDIQKVTIANQILSTFKFLGQSDQGTSGKYTGKYFSIGPSDVWLFQSDANQSPATPEVLQTVSFAYDKARLNILVGTDSVSRVLDSQDGEIKGTIMLDNIVGTKKSGYGGIAGSVYSVSVVADYKGRYYLIGFYTQEDKLKEKYEDSFNKLLSTFKFTD